MKKQASLLQRATALDLPQQVGDVVDLAWAPDGQRLAAVTHLGYLCVWNTHNGALTVRTRLARADLLTVAWARQGNVLAAGSIDGRLYRIEDLKAATPVVHCYPFADSITKISWSPSPIGRCLVVAGSLLTVLNERGDDPLRVGYAAPIRDAAWSSDGRTCAVLCEDGLIDLWDVSLRKVRCSFTTISQPRCLSWHRDGRQFAVGTMTGQIQVRDLQGQEIQSTAKLSPFPLDALRWGKTCLVAMSNQGIVLWNGVSSCPLEIAVQTLRGPVPLICDPQGEYIALPASGAVTIAPLAQFSA